LGSLGVGRKANKERATLGGRRQDHHSNKKETPGNPAGKSTTYKLEEHWSMDIHNFIRLIPRNKRKCPVYSL